MKLKAVVIEGMHNVERRRYEFDQFSYFHGPNGSGKSTAMQAVQLGLLGYIPGTNKTKEAIFKHCNSSMMAVTLELDDSGTPVTVKRMWMGMSPNINSVVNVSPEGYSIDGILGDIELPVFNFKEFLDLTANKLKDWFIEFLPSAKVDTDWEKVLKEKLENDSVAKNDDLVKEACEKIKEFNLSGVDEIRKANEYFKSAQSFEKKSLERNQSTIQSLVYYDDVSDELSEDEIKRRMDELSEKKSSIYKFNLAMKQDERILVALKEYDDCEANSPEEDDSYKKAVKASADAYAERCEVENQKSSLLDSQREIIAKGGELAKESVRIRSEIDTRRFVVAGEGICPYTKSSCEAVLVLSDAYRNEIEEFTKPLNDIKNQQSDLDEENRKVQELIDHCNDQITKLSAFEQNCRRIQIEIQNRYETKDKLNAQLVAIPDVPTESEEEINEELEKLKDIQIKQAANKRYSDMIEMLSSQKYKIESNIAAYKSWISLTGVNGLQASSEANGPFEVLADNMNKYICKLFPDCITSFNIEGKANSFSFGISRSGNYIPYSMLSSGEKCMYALSLLLSLVEVANSKLKLIMVDDLFDHLDDVNMDKLISTLKDVANIQLICAGVQEIDPEYMIEI